MSKYTAEQARDWHRRESSWRNQLGMYESKRKHSEMADAIDALLRERESAKAGVTDEIVYRACKAGRITRDEPPEHELAAMRRKLEAVAPMLASAQVPDGWQLVPVEPTDGMVRVVYPLHWYDGPGHRLKVAYKQMLAAAPKPEKE